MPSKSQCLGWSSFFSDQLHAQEQALRPARITADSGHSYTVLDTEGTLSTLPTLHETGIDRPAVGDWLLLPAASNSAFVRRLARKSTLIRQRAGRSSAPQVIAANLDTVFIVTAMGADFNPRRIDRYLATILGGGAQPVVVINKVDLAPAGAGRLQAQLPDEIPVVVTSALHDIGIDALQPWLQPGQTVGFVGSSGVGKSSLVNALLREDRLATGEIRISDEQGQHTTTRRELVQLPTGAMLMDTPGMRELGLWSEEGLAAAFQEIGEVGTDCQFRDCQHHDEPGCAVRAAIEQGQLTGARLDSFLKLQREVQRHQRRREVVARRDRRKLEKTSRRNARLRDRKRAARQRRHAQQGGRHENR